MGVKIPKREESNNYTYNKERLENELKCLERLRCGLENTPDCPILVVLVNNREVIGLNEEECKKFRGLVKQNTDLLKEVETLIQENEDLNKRKKELVQENKSLSNEKSYLLEDILDESIKFNLLEKKLQLEAEKLYNSLGKPEKKKRLQSIRQLFKRMTNR